MGKSLALLSEPAQGQLMDRGYAGPHRKIPQCEAILAGCAHGMEKMIQLLHLIMDLVLFLPPGINR